MLGTSTKARVCATKVIRCGHQKFALFHGERQFFQNLRNLFPSMKKGITNWSVENENGNREKNWVPLLLASLRSVDAAKLASPSPTLASSLDVSEVAISGLPAPRPFAFSPTHSNFPPIHFCAEKHWLSRSLFLCHFFLLGRACPAGRVCISHKGNYCSAGGEVIESWACEFRNETVDCICHVGSSIAVYPGSHAMNQSAFSCTLAASVSSCPIRFSNAILKCTWHHGMPNSHMPLEGAAANLKTSSKCRQNPIFFRISRLQKNSYVGTQPCPGLRHYSRRCNICRQNIKIVRASFDDEFRSSQSIALGLHRRYKSVVQGGFTHNLRNFIDAGVTAYAVGCTTEDLRKELLNIGASGDLKDTTAVSSGSVGIKSKLTAEEVEECILWTSILFITILCTPQPTIVRWSSTPPVTAEAQVQWRGFCELIAKAYYERGMAWMPVKTLQMEQMAVAGYAEEPSLVADRMRLVFATLEAVSPQWPKR